MAFSLAELKSRIEAEGYIIDDEAALTVYLALKLEKPLLIEGSPGVGKTEMGKVLARVFRTELIRLQCYEGLDENKALYEWNYQRQLLRIQLSREMAVAGSAGTGNTGAGDTGAGNAGEGNMGAGNAVAGNTGTGNTGAPLEEKHLFTADYLLERPLLKAIRAPEKTVLLIDEIDKCDQEFEAFLFETLSDFQVSVPELGTIHARHIPIVVLTSNSERELSDGLRRRCVFLYLDFPSIEKEIQIINRKVPRAGPRLTEEIARVVSALRHDESIRKKPSIAETLDWARALVALDSERLSPSLIDNSLGLLLKSGRDQQYFREELGGNKICTTCTLIK